MPTGKRGAHPEAVYKALDLCVDGWKGQGHAHNQKAPGPASLAQGMHSQWQASRGTPCATPMPIVTGHTTHQAIIHHQKGRITWTASRAQGHVQVQLQPPRASLKAEVASSGSPPPRSRCHPRPTSRQAGCSPQSQAPSTQCAAPISNCQANKGHRATSLQQHQASHTQPQK